MPYKIGREEKFTADMGEHRRGDRRGEGPDFKNRGLSEESGDYGIVNNYIRYIFLGRKGAALSPFTYLR